jgi:hypothetical protein
MVQRELSESAKGGPSKTRFTTNINLDPILLIDAEIGIR